MESLIDKSVKTLQEGGISEFVKKSIHYISKKLFKKQENHHIAVADVLFINGCSLPHPYRYRVQHQREQLAAYNISTEEVYYTDLTMEMINYFHTFIIYRCTLTSEVKRFIEKAKYFNKSVIFDIDDLVIDTKYTNLIPYVANMSPNEKIGYDEGVHGYHDTMLMCDAVITTTERLATELNHYVGEVFINRNVFSETMYVLSNAALNNKKDNPYEIVLGYFSGSITHNSDFEMILPVLTDILNRYDCVKILVVGELDLPKELKRFHNRIINKPFINWTKLPDLIASVDINLVPLTNTIFNEAKSENKWMEAALVKVPTIASNLGAFKHAIEHNYTGMLCDTIEDWEKFLTKLIEDSNLRKNLAENAHQFVIDHYSSIKTGMPLRNFILNNKRKNIAFLFPSFDVSGGVLVALKHCDILREHGYDVVAINLDTRKSALQNVFCGQHEISSIVAKNIQFNINYDKVVATMWFTTEYFNKFNTRRNYYLVQNFEPGFYEVGSCLRLQANKTYVLDGVNYITISLWCQEWLQNKYGVDSRYAPNGLERQKFYDKPRDFNGKIRILIEGDSESDYKNVDESFKIVELLDKNKYEIWYVSYNGKAKDWYHVDQFFNRVPYGKMPDLYRQCHILLKTSILESFSYPPLEMMATGGFVVARENGGNKEYLKDGDNCLFYNFNDLHTAIASIEAICNDENVRQKLVMGGKKTADSRDWNVCEDIVLKLYED